jgi:hypothetical protein
VLLDRRRRLIAEYGGSPPTMMLIDRAVAAYQDFIRIAGWTGNAVLMVEHEFFGVDRPSANVLDRYGREAREIRGLTVEEHIQSPEPGPDPARRALRPHDARGASGSGDAAKRAEYGGRAVTADRDLSQDGLAASWPLCSGILAPARAEGIQQAFRI